MEFSSPNIAKPFHAGHLRSTIIGNYVRNVFQANGYETIAMNYLGDWGKQYGLLAVGFERFGSEEELLKDAIKHLYDVYVQINVSSPLFLLFTRGKLTGDDRKKLNRIPLFMIKPGRTLTEWKKVIKMRWPCGKE